MRYLLDTNILDDLAKRPDGAARRRLAGLEPSAVCTSIIVVAEVRYGFAKRPSAKLEAAVAAILATIDVIPFDDPADRSYGIIRAELEQAGTQIGPNDLIIAAQALALGLIVVTDNEREFRRVPGLLVENWLRA